MEQFNANSNIQLIPVIALYDYQTTDKTKLSFKAGQILYVVCKHTSGWWNGLIFEQDQLHLKNGWFPATYVKETNVPMDPLPPPPPRPEVPPKSPSLGEKVKKRKRRDIMRTKRKSLTERPESTIILNSPLSQQSMTMPRVNSDPLDERPQSTVILNSPLSQQSMTMPRVNSDPLAERPESTVILNSPMSQQSMTVPRVTSDPLAERPESTIILKSPLSQQSVKMPRVNSDRPPSLASLSEKENQPEKKVVEEKSKPKTKAVLVEEETKNEPMKNLNRNDFVVDRESLVDLLEKLNFKIQQNRRAKSMISLRPHTEIQNYRKVSLDKDLPPQPSYKLEEKLDSKPFIRESLSVRPIKEESLSDEETSMPVVRRKTLNNSKNHSKKLSKFFGEMPSPSLDSEKLNKFFGEQPPEVSPVSDKMKNPTPAFLLPDYSKSDLIFNMDGDNKVKAGTLHALVERLTAHDTLDVEFSHAFLLTFRLFTQPAEFLRLLSDRFQLQPPSGLDEEDYQKWKDKKQKPIQLRVYKTIRKWLEEYWFEKEDGYYIDQIKILAKGMMAKVMPKEAEKLIELCINRKTLKDDEAVKSKLSLYAIYASSQKEKPPNPIVPRNLNDVQLLDLDPLEIARQISLMASENFNKIHPLEFLFYKSDRKESENPIKLMIQHANQITGWVSENILLESEPKKRAAVMKQFIKIANQCHLIKNYAAREAILSGLQSSPIYRLKKTWECLSPKYKTLMDSLVKQMDRDNNFLTYRQSLKTTFPPCIPFLGLYLTDVTFIKQGNPDYLNHGRLINFDKYYKLSTLVDEISRLQNLGFNFKLVPEIQEYLKDGFRNCRELQDLYELSMLVEPREKQNWGDERDEVLNMMAIKGLL